MCLENPQPLGGVDITIQNKNDLISSALDLSFDARLGFCCRMLVKPIDQYKNNADGDHSCYDYGVPLFS